MGRNETVKVILPAATQNKANNHAFEGALNRGIRRRGGRIDEYHFEIDDRILTKSGLLTSLKFFCLLFYQSVFQLLILHQQFFYKYFYNNYYRDCEKGTAYSRKLGTNKKGQYYCRRLQTNYFGHDHWYY